MFVDFLRLYIISAQSTNGTSLGSSIKPNFPTYHRCTGGFLASISFHNLVDQSDICYLFYIVKIICTNPFNMVIILFVSFIFFTLFYVLNIEISILTIWTVTDFQFELMEEVQSKCSEHTDQPAL